MSMWICASRWTTHRHGREQSLWGKEAVHLLWMLLWISQQFAKDANAWNTAWLSVLVHVSHWARKHRDSRLSVLVHVSHWERKHQDSTVDRIVWCTTHILMHSITQHMFWCILCAPHTCARLLGERRELPPQQARACSQTRNHSWILPCLRPRHET